MAKKREKGYEAIYYQTQPEYQPNPNTHPKFEEWRAEAAQNIKKEQAQAERKRAQKIKVRALRSRRSSLFFEEGRETIG